jgi:hypothetical protein
VIRIFGGRSQNSITLLYPEYGFVTTSAAIPASPIPILRSSSGIDGLAAVAPDLPKGVPPITTAAESQRGACNDRAHHVNATGRPDNHLHEIAG